MDLIDHFWDYILSTHHFMPHGYCYLWNPYLVSLHVISDGITTLAYFSIPMTLLYIFMKRKDIYFSSMLIWFGLFIVACGATHIMSIVTLWKAWYWWAGIIKLITAIASLATAILLIKLIPKMLAIPSQQTLLEVNDRLMKEQTLLKDLKEELTLKNNELESVNRAKDNFLACMSHEIRTPINGIATMTQLLLNSSLTNEQKEELEIIQFSEEQLLRVVNEILDFSKIESDHIELEQIQFDFEKLLIDCISFFSAQIEKHNVSLNYVFDKDIPKIIEGDYNKIRQVLFNLLSNAIKFTEKGQININTGLKKIIMNENDNYNALIYISVSDTGLGISEIDLKKIFHPFSQGNTCTLKKNGGTGLGLFISKRLIEKMGGLLKVESTLGKGSTFYFTLPFKYGTKKLAVKNHNPKIYQLPDLVLNKEKYILVAEDNVINQKIIIKILSKLGLKNIDIVSDGNEALNAIEIKKYNVILMDCQMPQKDGYMTTKEIRKKETQENAQHIPIIAMTAYAMAGDKEKCLECGMDDYISKPINIQLLGSLLQKYLDRS